MARRTVGAGSVLTSAARAPGSRTGEEGGRRDGRLWAVAALDALTARRVGRGGEQAHGGEAVGPAAAAVDSVHLVFLVYENGDSRSVRGERIPFLPTREISEGRIARIRGAQ